MSGLDKLFEGAACKHLSAVDATPKSNQHEIGSNKFKVILGNPEGQKLRFNATFLLFTEDAEDPISLVDTVTYYDPRFGNPNRSPELRLYYRDNLVTEQIQEGDFCIIAKRTESAELLIAFARSGSVHEHRLRHLFKLDKPVDGWQISEKISDEEINLATRSILDALGIEVLDAKKNISAFDPADGDLNPAKIYTFDKKGYKFTLVGETGGVATVEMVPGGKAAQVKHISLKINTSDFTVKSWTIVNKTGKKQLFTVTKLNPKAGADDAFFTFNKKAFPGVEVNDLR